MVSSDYRVSCIPMATGYSAPAADRYQIVQLSFLSTSRLILMDGFLVVLCAQLNNLIHRLKTSKKTFERMWGEIGQTGKIFVRILRNIFNSTVGFFVTRSKPERLQKLLTREAFDWINVPSQHKFISCTSNVNRM